MKATWRGKREELAGEEVTNLLRTYICTVIRMRARPYVQSYKVRVG